MIHCTILTLFHLGPLTNIPRNYLYQNNYCADDDEKQTELNAVNDRLKDLHIETAKTRWFGSSSNFQ